MIALYLVRHAIGEQRDRSRWPDDSKRPLTSDGEARFRRAARGLHRLVPAVDRMLSSPYTRSWQTAELLGDEAGWPAPEPADALAASSSPAAAVPLVHDRHGVTSLALVGHEPNLSMLASLLLTGDQDAVQLELKKGGVIALDVDSAHAVLRWVATPRILRAIQR